MPRDPLTHLEMRKWLTRRQLLRNIDRLRQCRYGHVQCSSQRGGPCFIEVRDRFYGMAKDRALEMATFGADRDQVALSILREYPVLEQLTMETIVEEAFSQ